LSACPSCNANLPAGIRWCPICHTNVINPQFGRVASPSRRLGAYVLDYLVVGIVALIAFVTGDGMVASVLVIAYAIFALILFAKGTIPGKMMLGLHVAKENGERAGFFTMLIREVIGKTVSGLVFGLGFLWIMLDKESQGWHDKLMSTYVVHK
jgi:uncharacterized RDD family membrane protein YckC